MGHGQCGGFWVQSGILANLSFSHPPLSSSPQLCKAGYFGKWLTGRSSGSYTPFSLNDTKENRSPR